jgi:hypothetical protein
LIAASDDLIGSTVLLLWHFWQIISSILEFLFLSIVVLVDLQI